MPMIFVSGDDRLKHDLEVMPWIEFVVTKKATSASTVELRSVDSVHAEMREKAHAERKPAMKSFSTLSKDDLDALVAYIQTLKKKS